MAVPVGAVVVGVDGTDKDRRAVDWAAEEAARRGSPLHVLYAFPWITSSREYGTVPGEEIVRASEKITRAAVDRARARHPDLPVTTEVVLEDAAVALVRASRNASVVVVGARGMGRIGGRLLGSVSQKVTAHAHGPVVVVRDVVPAASGPVVVGVDPDDESPEVLQFAFAQAVRRGVGVRVVHGGPREMPRPEFRDEWVERLLDTVAEEQALEVERIASTWSDRYPGVPVDVREVRRHPVEALAEESADASLVVVGSRGRGGLPGLRLGSVSRGVLHEAPVVAVVRVPPEVPPH